jgi:hypothetical protein
MTVASRMSKPIEARPPAALVGAPLHFGGQRKTGGHRDNGPAPAPKG